MSAFPTGPIAEADIWSKLVEKSSSLSTSPIKTLND